MRLGLFAMALAAISAGAAAEGPLAPSLPDGIEATGRQDIAAAWLTLPTDRYGHGVLGDAIEAGGLEVRMTSGRHVALELPLDRVFEDRQARLADLDGDGRDEILVVESDLEAGARLSVYGLSGDEIVLRAATPFVGQPNRWLNPAGVADFAAAAGLEVALVLRPHLDGTLQLLSYDPSSQSLRLVAEAGGFSNHAIGSSDLSLSAVVPDRNGDGLAELLLPRAGRRVLALVSFHDDGVSLLWEETLTAPVRRDFRWQDGAVVVEQGDGSLWHKRFN